MSTIKCEVGDGSHIPSGNEINEDGYPKHSASTDDIQLRLCFDARKDTCAYAVAICIDTEFLNVNQCFCAYRLRK